MDLSEATEMLGNESGTRRLTSLLLVELRMEYDSSDLPPAFASSSRCLYLSAKIPFSLDFFLMELLPKISLYF